MELSQKKAGQSILEIAIFGSILLAIIGAILQYGLKYNYQQRAMMRAFRRSLAATGDYDRGNQGSITYLQDRHVPNASNPQGGVGSVLPFMSGSSVIRNYQLINTPDRNSELPLAYIYVNDDTNPYRFEVARFAYADATEAQYEKYCEVYGDLYVKDAQTNETPDYNVCIGYDAYGNCIPGPAGPKRLRIMDSCKGDLLSYDGCKRQCRMITVPSFCERECERGKRPGDTKNCNQICSETIDSPSYCSQLENIFSFALNNNKPPQMGIQPDSSQRTPISGTLRKSESGGTITTRDSLSWSSTVDRTMVYMNNGSNVVQRPLRTRLDESVTQRCTDGVCN